VIGRLVRREAFERVLATPARARSTRFAVHHHVGPMPPAELSTGALPGLTTAVDDLAAPRRAGWVVPKRHARRAVTRNLVKRSIRTALDRAAPGLPAGDWVVRLRAPIEPGKYPSAASRQLRVELRGELDALLERASR
jgi:ribonuclease P protein component